MRDRVAFHLEAAFPQESEQEKRTSSPQSAEQDDERSSVRLGGGSGLRFTLAKQDHINLRIDYAWGKNSTALYIGIMEAF
jgi:hypothetical protein